MPDAHYWSDAKRLACYEAGTRAAITKNWDRSRSFEDRTQHIYTHRVLIHIYSDVYICFP